jgi:predicted Zn-dependent protease
MTYQTLDNDELLRLALNAMNADRDPEAIDLLKTLLERDPGHGYGQYLLAAMHAQIGMMDRAEAGFRAAVAAMPELAVARFQLGQLLVLQGRGDETRDVLAPLAAAAPGEALGAYARALTAAAGDDAATAIAELGEGLRCDQPIPALAGDMQRLLERLQSADGAPPPAAPMFLSGYGRQ